MITRGYYIGEIVDAFADIAKQAELRAKLNLTDQHVYIEDFFRICLNHLWQLELVGLNKDTANAPGLDLGDATAARGFQITTTRTSEKVNSTLNKVKGEFLATYPKITVLIIGRRQKDYKIDAGLAAALNFGDSDIWDLEDLARRTMELDVAQLQLLYEHVRIGTAKVKIELEVPDSEGNYPTSLFNSLEQKPQAQASDFKRLVATKDCVEAGVSTGDLQSAFATLAAGLSRLPRVTRELLAIMIEERDDPAQTRGPDEYFRISADRLPRILPYPDCDGDLRILKGHGWIDDYDAEFTDGNPYWRIDFPWSAPDELHVTVDKYLASITVPWRRVIVALDFSVF